GRPDAGLARAPGGLDPDGVVRPHAPGPAAVRGNRHPRLAAPREGRPRLRESGRGGATDRPLAAVPRPRPGSGRDLAGHGAGGGEGALRPPPRGPAGNALRPELERPEEAGGGAADVAAAVGETQVVERVPVVRDLGHEPLESRHRLGKLPELQAAEPPQEARRRGLAHGRGEPVEQPPRLLEMALVHQSPNPLESLQRIDCPYLPGPSHERPPSSYCTDVRRGTRRDRAPRHNL